MTTEAERDALSAPFICIPLPFVSLLDGLLRSLLPIFAYEHIMQNQMTTFLNDTTLTQIGMEIVADL